jgi:hypothetical protein
METVRYKKAGWMPHGQSSRHTLDGQLSLDAGASVARGRTLIIWLVTTSGTYRKGKFHRAAATLCFDLPPYWKSPATIRN